MNICVIMAAAGKGTRYGQSDKLAQDLGGRAVLLRTVEAFAKRGEVKSILVAAPPDRIGPFREKYGPTLGFHGAKVVEGGQIDRWETVRKALAEVPADATHVAVHDAARPAVSATLLDRVFEAARSVSAVVPAVAVDCTVRRIDTDPTDVADHSDGVLADSILGAETRPSIEAHRVVETIARDGLMLVQTPQVFEVDLLRRAYAQDDLSGLTDDAGAVERLGEPVFAVAGDVTNIKLTTPEDLPLLRAILGLKAPAERPVHKRF